MHKMFHGMLYSRIGNSFNLWVNIINHLLLSSPFIYEFWEQYHRRNWSQIDLRVNNLTLKWQRNSTGQADLTVTLEQKHTVKAITDGKVSWSVPLQQKPQTAMLRGTQLCIYFQLLAEFNTE